MTLPTSCSPRSFDSSSCLCLSSIFWLIESFLSKKKEKEQEEEKEKEKEIPGERREGISA